MKGRTKKLQPLLVKKNPQDKEKEKPGEDRDDLEGS